MIRRGLVAIIVFVLAGPAFGQGVSLPVPQRVVLDNGVSGVLPGKR